MNSISQNIKAYRKQNNLTQQQMADRLGVTHQTVSNWESGRSLPNIDKLNYISEKLDIDINYLLYGKKADNTDLERQIKKYFVWFVFCLLFGIFTIAYQEYRLANDVNLHIQSTIDLRYILPGRIYAPFIRPWVYILPVFITFSILKHKGLIRDRAENKIFPLVKIILILLLVYCGIAYWWIWGLSPVYNVNFFVSYIPVNIRVIMGNSTVFFMENPAVFSRMALICEVFRPFANDKTIIPAHSPGRNNIIAQNIRKLRIDSGLSQQQMAEKLFVTRQTLSNWENGKSMPDVSKLMQICETAGINLNTLLYRENRADRKTKLSLILTVMLMIIAIAVSVTYELMWFFVADLMYRPSWISYSFNILKNLKKVVTYPLLWYTVPVLSIQFLKLTGRMNKIKGVKYYRLLFVLSMAFLFLTAYSYLPIMLKTDIKRAIQISHPVLWMNYPSFDWLIQLPYPVTGALIYIATDMKWLYSVMGMVTELSRPYNDMFARGENE